MGWAHYAATARNLEVYLVDGYLPPRNALEQLAELSATEPVLGRHGRAYIPCRWETHDEDCIFEKLAFNIRQAYCAKRPSNKRCSIWSEAWLLNPARGWPTEFELKNQEQGQSSRRLLVTLYEDCDFGQKCVQNLVKETCFKVIPKEEYLDYEAFAHKAETLLEDISTPFIAPCIVAGEKINENSYNYRAFGK